MAVYNVILLCKWRFRWPLNAHTVYYLVGILSILSRNIRKLNTIVEYHKNPDMTAEVELCIERLLCLFLVYSSCILFSKQLAECIFRQSLGLKENPHNSFSGGRPSNSEKVYSEYIHVVKKKKKKDTLRKIVLKCIYLCVLTRDFAFYAWVAVHFNWLQ